MRDLDHQLRDYIDAVAPAVDIDEVKAGAPAMPEPIPIAEGRRSRRWLPVAAVAAAVAVLAGVVVLVQRSSDPAQLDAGAGAVAAWDWLAPLGTEVDAPPVPSGWKVLDFADLRFAVPQDWTVPLSESCAHSDGETPGVVLLPSVDGQTCTSGGETNLPESVVRIEKADTTLDGGDPDQIGTFSATRFDDSACSDCPSVYRLDNGYQVSVTGTDAHRVLATFTDSGARRALQAGALADTSGWRSLDYAGIGLSIPAEWGVANLAASTQSITRPDGTIQWSSLPSPMANDESVFGPDLPYRAYVGDSGAFQGGPAPLHYNLEPTNGVWIRTITDADTQSLTELGMQVQGDPPVVLQGEVEGLAVSVFRYLRRGPAIDLIVRDGATTWWISLGVGLESSTARSVLRSLHRVAAPASTDPVPTSTETTALDPAQPACASLLQVPTAVPAEGLTVGNLGVNQGYRLEPVTDPTGLIDLDQAEAAVVSDAYAGRPVRGLLARVTRLGVPHDPGQPLSFDQTPLWILVYTLDEFDVLAGTGGPHPVCMATHMAVLVDAQSGFGLFATAAA